MRYSHGPQLKIKKPIPEALTPGEISVLARKYTGRDRALFYFLYLTGARIIEALNVRIQDVRKEGNGIHTVRLTTVKNRRTRFRMIPILHHKIERPMLEYILNYIGKPRWKKARGDDSLVFPGLSKRNAWNRLAKETITLRAVMGTRVIEKYTKKINPHYLRHCRLSHLVQYYGFNDTQLTRFAGWTNSEPAQIYVHLDWKDLARAMGQNVVRPGVSS